MLLTILLLNLVLSLTNPGADAKTATKQGLEDLENLVESQLRDMETRMQENLEMRLHQKDREMEKRLESKDKEMETRLGEMEYKMKEEKDASEKKEMELKASVSKLRMEVEEYSNFSDCAMKITKPSLRDLPIVIISAWQHNILHSPQTVTFESFLANFNNAARPGGGDGVLDLDSGVFTCFTPGYYTVSFSAYAVSGINYTDLRLYLNKNGAKLPESEWFLATSASAVDDIGVTSSRILVSKLLEMFACVKSLFLQTLHLDVGDTLELSLTGGDYIRAITLNIELVGLGFDYLV